MIVRRLYVCTLRLEDHWEKWHHLALVVNLQSAERRLVDPFVLSLANHGNPSVKHYSQHLSLFLVDQRYIDLSDVKTGLRHFFLNGIIVPIKRSKGHRWANIDWLIPFKFFNLVVLSLFTIFHRLKDVYRGDIADFKHLWKLVCVNRYVHRTFIPVLVHQAHWICSIQDVQRKFKISRSLWVLRFDGNENFIFWSAEKLDVEHKLAIKDLPPGERPVLFRWTGFNILQRPRSSLEITQV